MTNKQENHSL